jgi:hypothetical protein
MWSEVIQRLAVLVGDKHAQIDRLAAGASCQQLGILRNALAVCLEEFGLVQGDRDEVGADVTNDLGIVERSGPELGRPASASLERVAIQVP